MGGQGWREPKFALMGFDDARDPLARVRAFVHHRVALKTACHSPANAVNEFNALIRSVSLIAWLQGYWEVEQFRWELAPVVEGRRQLSAFAAQANQRVKAHHRAGGQTVRTLGKVYHPAVLAHMASRGRLWAMCMFGTAFRTFVRNVEIRGPFQLQTLVILGDTSGNTGPDRALAMGSHTFSYKRQKGTQNFVALAAPTADWRMCPVWLLCAQLVALGGVVDGALQAIIDGAVRAVTVQTEEGTETTEPQPAWWGISLFPQIRGGAGRGSPDPYAPPSIETFNRYLGEAFGDDGVGIPAEHRPHARSSVLRKGALEEAKASGMTITDAMDIAGWVAPGTCQKSYAPHVQDWDPLLRMAGYAAGDGLSPSKRFKPPIDYGLVEKCLQEAPHIRAVIQDNLWPSLGEARRRQQARVDLADAGVEPLADTSALAFIGLLEQARTIFLAGAPLMQALYPALPCWRTPLFSHPGFQGFFTFLGDRVRTSVREREAELARLCAATHDQIRRLERVIEDLARQPARGGQSRRAEPPPQVAEPIVPPPPEPAEALPATQAREWPQGGKATLEAARDAWTKPAGHLLPLSDIFTPPAEERVAPADPLIKRGDRRYFGADDHTQKRQGKNLQGCHKALMVAMDIRARTLGEAEVRELVAKAGKGIDTFHKLAAACEKVFKGAGDSALRQRMMDCKLMF